MKIDTRSIVYGMAVLLFCAGSANATVYSAAQSGNWTNTATWSPSGSPSVADRAVIALEHTVMLSTSVELGPDAESIALGDWSGSNGHLVLDGTNAALIVRGNFFMGHNAISNTIAINGGSLSVDWSFRIGRWGSASGVDTVTLNGGTLYAGALDMAITADTNVGNQGHLQINSGDVTVGGLAMGPGGSIDVAGDGRLIVLGRNITDISEVEDGGSITADGGNGVFIYEYRSDLNLTTITTAPPLSEIPILAVDQLPGTNALAFTWNTQPVGEYELQGKTSLMGTNWIPVITAIPGGNTGNVTVTATVDQVEFFYRVIGN